MVGGNCGVYEGTVVRAGAVLAAGVVLTRGTPVYDLVQERVYKAEADRPLEIPAGAVGVLSAGLSSAGLISVGVTLRFCIDGVDMELDGVVTVVSATGKAPNMPKLPKAPKPA